MLVAMVAAGLLIGPHPLAGQTGRAMQPVAAGEPEGRLMAFYSSVLAFSPLGGATGARVPRLGIALELSLIPRLSATQRTVLADKPEATNLAPLLARPRLEVALGRGVALEASWIPPNRTFDVHAQLGALALALPTVRWGGTSVATRVSALAGTVRGAVTCSDRLARAGVDLARYYALVCHGSPSDDRFEPRHLAAELVVARGAGALRPYVALGARGERTRFDIGVIRPDGSRDPDQPVLELRAVRTQIAAGVAWRPRRRPFGAAEAYWAPGSVLTVRVLGGARVW